MGMARAAPEGKQRGPGKVKVKRGVAWVSENEKQAGPRSGCYGSESERTLSCGMHFMLCPGERETDFLFLPTLKWWFGNHHQEQADEECTHQSRKQERQVFPLTLSRHTGRVNLMCCPRREWGVRKRHNVQQNLRS